jgi:hypothetical protein
MRSDFPDLAAARRQAIRLAGEVLMRDPSHLADGKFDALVRNEDQSPALRVTVSLVPDSPDVRSIPDTENLDAVPPWIKTARAAALHPPRRRYPNAACDLG